MSQTTSIQNNGIIIYVYSDPSTQGKGVIQVVADHPVASTLAISLNIQYGVSSGDRRTYNLTLAKGQYLFYGCNREYSQAINYKIDTVDPSDWTPSGSYSHGSITVKKGNLSPSDFSGGILIELILGNKINGYVKRVMLRIKVN